MPTAIRTLPLLAVVLWAAGCGADTAPGDMQDAPATSDASVDLSTAIDLRTARDAAPLDLTTDQSSIDFAVDDRADAAKPFDLAVVMSELPMPDFAMPDFAMPDLAMPDFAMPDLAMPDLAMPDLAMPDLAMPDLAKAPDLSPVACGSFGFNAAVTYPVGLGTYALAVGDFNKDGLPDLVSGNLSDSSISVLLNKGAGIFDTQKQAFLVGNGAKTKPTGLAVADFNNDGKLDVMTADYLANMPGGGSLFLGNGDGTFQANTFTNVGSATHDVVALDANSDGNMDVAFVWTAGNLLNYASVFLGNGDGTFKAAKVLVVEKAPQSITAGDFNRDGFPDLVTTNSIGTVDVLLGNGDGTFAGQVSYQVGAGPTGITARNLDLDGNLDLVVALTGLGSVGVLGGTANGTFGAVATYTMPAYTVAVGDFNCDGKPDVVGGVLTSPGSAQVAFGDGKLGLGNAAMFTTGNHTIGVAVGDFDGDGHADIAAANQNDGTVSVLLNASK